MDMGADVCSGAVCRGAQLSVAADACSAGVRCVGDYDSRPSVCHADTSGSVPAAPIQSRESVVGDGAYCRGYRGGSYGFPSCHAANSFALASFLTLLFANRKLSLFILRGRCLIPIRASILECIIQAICLSEQLSALWRVWLWLCRRLCGRPCGQTASEAECQHWCGHIGRGVYGGCDCRGFMFRENVTELLTE